MSSIPPSVASFLFEAVNFSLLVGGLSWFFFAPIRKALAEESDRIEKETAASQSARKEADASLEAAKQAEVLVGSRAHAEREEALARARKEAERVLGEARGHETARRAAFEKELDARAIESSLALAGLLGSIAAETIRELLATLEGPSLDAALVRLAVSELAKLPLDARRASMVEVARELDSESSTLLASALGATLPIRLVPELGAGIRITTSAGQVDVTAASIARRVAIVVTSSANGRPHG